MGTVGDARDMQAAETVVINSQSDGEGTESTNTVGSTAGRSAAEFANDDAAAAEGEATGEARS